MVGCGKGGISLPVRIEGEPLDTVCSACKRCCPHSLTSGTCIKVVHCRVYSLRGCSLKSKKGSAPFRYSLE